MHDCNYTVYMSSKVLLVDDHQIVRYATKAILERQQDFRVAGEVGTGDEAIRFVAQDCPDVVLMDIGLPDMSGLDATTEIIRNHPSCKVVMLSMYGDENSVIGAARSGARGFLLKSTSEGGLLEALRAVVAGDTYFSPEVSSRLLFRVQGRGKHSEDAETSAMDALSPRELQVVRLVAQGKTSKEVAVDLNLREQTIRSYRKTLMKKLEINNTSSLTRLAYAAGLVEFESRISA